MRRWGTAVHRVVTTRGGLVLAAAVAAAGCDGGNRFSGPVDVATDRPRVEITIPRGDSTALPLRDSIFIEARFRDNTGVDSVRFFGETIRGDPSIGTDVLVQRFEVRSAVLPSVRDTTLGRFLIPTADTVKEFTNLIAQGFDKDGNLGADTIRVQLGGPGVRILDLQDNQSVQAGLSLNLSAVARDPEGVTSLTFVLDGAVTQTLVRNFTPPADSVRVDTTVAIPAGIQGSFTLTARAINNLGLSGGDGPLTLNIVTGGVTDTIAPRLSLTVQERERVELGDSLIIQVQGSDDPAGTGVATVGYTVRALSPTRGDTVMSEVTRAFAPARTGTLAQQFGVPILNVDSLSLPDTLVYEITAFMVDAAGNCGAAVDDQGTFGCRTLAGGQTGAQDRDGFSTQMVVVAGQTVFIPGTAGGGIGAAQAILDAQIDTVRRNLFLSNSARNQVEVFRLDAETFGPAIGVGSRPWGLALTRDGDSLWVANSGGTNFSVVDLGTEREVENNRLRTPDVLLFDLELRQSDAGNSFVVHPLPEPASPSFSDRPQFMAVDSFGNVVYSTVATLVGDMGTARKAFFPTGAVASEVRLFVEHGLVQPQDNFWALAHIDSIRGAVEGGVAGVRFFDHVPGFPDNVISGFFGLNEPPELGWDALVAQGSDAAIVSAARWDVGTIGFSDTTYVAGSGDGGWIAVGEGATSPVGRVLMYEAQPDEITALSGILPVSDFLTNASERVRGVGVNYDGTLVVARGDLAYFFNEKLRVEGVNEEVALPSQAQGATFHPLHANFPTLENPLGQYRPDIHLAFVGSGNRTVDIIDTQRFRRIGSVTIRDNIVGPLRAILPFASDNAGRICATSPVTDRRGNTIGNAVLMYNANDFTQPMDAAGASEDACVVVKLFGVTSAGGVVVIPVRKADVLREHPNRP
ncbi:MAG: hypothetical protein RQ751_10065, partial [Longimicrobiales bacterium]|nr:hypothetical protein [Longimicrobiales bacterium]